MNRIIKSGWGRISFICWIFCCIVLLSSLSFSQDHSGVGNAGDDTRLTFKFMATQFFEYVKNLPELQRKQVLGDHQIEDLKRIIENVNLMEVTELHPDKFGNSEPIAKNFRFPEEISIEGGLIKIHKTRFLNSSQKMAHVCHELLGLLNADRTYSTCKGFYIQEEYSLQLRDVCPVDFVYRVKIDKVYIDIPEISSHFTNLVLSSDILFSLDDRTQETGVYIYNIGQEPWKIRGAELTDVDSDYIYLPKGYNNESDLDLQITIHRVDRWVEDEAMTFNLLKSINIPIRPHRKAQRKKDFYESPDKSIAIEYTTSRVNVCKGDANDYAYINNEVLLVEREFNFYRELALNNFSDPENHGARTKESMMNDLASISLRLLEFRTAEGYDSIVLKILELKDRYL